MVAAKPCHDCLDAGATQAVEGQAGNVRVRSERRLVVRPAGQQKQDASRGDPVQALLDHLERGRVDPMGVLENHQHRLSCSQARQLIDQGVQRPYPLRLRGQVEGAISCSAVEAEQVGDQGCGVAPIRSVEQRLQLVQPGLNRVVRTQAAAWLSCWITGQSGLSA
jgi:hypothetical protein